MDKPNFIDTPVLHLDRAIVASALESGEPLWCYSTRTGWLRIAFYDRAPGVSPLNVSAVEDESGKVQITFTEPSPARRSQIKNGQPFASLKVGN